MGTASPMPLHGQVRQGTLLFYVSCFSHATAPSGSPRNPFGSKRAAFRMPLHRQVRQGTLLGISEQLSACHCSVRFAKESFWKYASRFSHATAPSGSPRNHFGSKRAAFSMPLHRQVRQGTLLEVSELLFACHCTVKIAKGPF